MKRMHKITVRGLFWATLCLCVGSCDSEKDPASGNGESLQARVVLQTLNMTQSGEGSVTRSADGIMEVAFGQAPATRAATALTTEEEAKVNNLSYFEFSGTADASRCIKKGHLSSLGTDNVVALTLSTSTDTHRVYAVANLGDVTAGVTAEETGASGTLLSDFKALTYALTNDANVGTTGLPMLGSTDMVPATMSASITLKRLVARINVICNVSVPTGDSFTCRTMQLKSVPNVGKYVSVASYPDNGVAGNFFDYAELTTNSGTWYIPENRRGTVTNTDAALKNSLAPAYSTYVDMAGVYSQAGVQKEVAYRIYLGGNATNDFEILGNTVYNATVTVKGLNETDARIIKLVADLSQNVNGGLETANSYIVREGGKSYKFNATVMGNGATTAASSISGQNAPAITPTTLAPTNALVLWETGSTKGGVIEDGSVTLANGYVTFKTANNSTPGNAVIAVRDASDNILWSWHIWKVPYNPNTEYETYTNFAGRSFKMMKYNLGATAISTWSGAATNAGDLGLFYQWGRKDPFVGASGWTTTLQTPAYTSPRVAKLNTEATVSGYNGADATIQYSILNPTYFIRGTSTVTYDWLNVTTYAEQRNNLWGNPNATATVPNPAMGSKSIYDPCPPGWRVPPQDAFTRFTTTGGNTNTLAQFNVVPSTMDTNKGYDFYYTATGSGASTYYPASGYLFWNTGALVSVSSSGVYWSSSSNVGGVVDSGGLIFRSSDVRPLSGGNRSLGFVVRCAQE